MIHLLYVDNNPDTCTIVAALCERIGSFTVKILNSGESALEWLQTSSADAIVSEYDMQGCINGIMLLRELRSRGTSTPFILFTANDSRTVRKKHAGMGYLASSAKPHWAKSRFTALSGQYTGRYCIREVETLANLKMEKPVLMKKTRSMKRQTRKYDQMGK